MKKSPSRSTRGRAKASAGRTKGRKALQPRKAASRKATGRLSAKPSAAKASGSATCQAPGCGKKFVPYGPLRNRQRFCSSTCRQRAFYWDFKNKHRGKRYAEVRGYR